MKKKITFFYPPKQDTFIKDIIKDLKKDYEVVSFSGGDEQLFWRTIHSSDYCWFEWGDDNVAGIMSNPAYSKYIVRIHSYEIFNNIQHKINWNKVSKLILVNDSIKEIIQRGIPGVMQGVPIPDDKINVIYHGIDLDKFKIPENKKFNKNVAYVGYLNHKKGIELLIQCFSAIHKYDPEFKFHIAGQQQDPRLAIYLNHLLPRLDFPIQFHGWVNDVPKFLEDKDFVISTSVFESYQFSIMEGMAQGCFPLVHNWFGADNVYPAEYIFDTIGWCVSIIDKIVQKSCKNKLPDAYNTLREYVDNNFSFKKQMWEIRKMLKEL
jgi:glycosyltransferase involved in cell wall biosynthesis